MEYEHALKQKEQPKEISKSIGLRLKENDLAVLNQRFRMDGFDNLSELVMARMILPCLIQSE
jgi:hypothetical protein